MMQEYQMNMATILFIVYTIYMSLTYIKVIVSKDNRAEHRKKRSQLTRLRAKPMKTVEEQKAFLDLKHPKKERKKFTFKRFMSKLLRVAFFVGLIVGVKYLWTVYVHFNFSLWHIIIYALLFPILVNSVLKKYGLQQDDILVYFR